MALRAANKAPGALDTRARLIEVAVRLFTQHSFAGTSLQMIADELGVTKAAVYHHFHTREELLSAIVEPLLAQLRPIIEAAEVKRTPQARAEHMLTGYAAIAVHNRAMIAVLAADRAVIEMLRGQLGLGDLIDRQIALLADVNPGPAGRVSAALVMAGIAGATGPPLVDLDDDALCQHLIDAGRRALGLRTPRRTLPSLAPGRAAPRRPGGTQPSSIDLSLTELRRS